MRKGFGAANLLLMAAVFVGNYFYFTVGGLTIKSVCSAGFALIGLVNLVYTARSKGDLKFAVPMSVGLLLAMLGDIVISDDFILGAVLFAGGHVCYYAAQCVFMKVKKQDLLVSALLFAGAGAFLLLCPLLSFPDGTIQAMCLGYALIISLMAGKAVSDFLREKNLLTAVLAAGCVLFFFSDLMLVFDWFMDAGRIAGVLCMSTYYPAECLLAVSVYLKAAGETKNGS